MKVSEAIKARRTIRGYKKEPVVQEVLKEILDIARYSPSNCNTQPWHFSVFSGDARDRLEAMVIDQIISGKQPAPAFEPGDKDLQGVYKDRQFQCAADYYGTMNIAREDKQKRQELMLKNWQFFGAPHVGVLSMPATMNAVNALDVGIYLQSLMLLFTEYGIASCPQGALAFYPEPFFELGDIPEGNGIICGISFGYEDVDAHINTVHMPRAPLADTVNFTS